MGQSFKQPGIFKVLPRVQKIHAIGPSMRTRLMGFTKHFLRFLKIPIRVKKNIYCIFETFFSASQHPQLDPLL